MNTLKVLVASAVLCMVGTEAKIDACTVDDWSVVVKAFSQGFQSDELLMTTDCFIQTTVTMNSAQYLFDSFYYYSHTDFLGPIYKLADLGIELVNIMTYCETVNFAKQLSIRTTTWGGLIEMLITISMSFVRNAVDPGQSELYNAFEVAFVTSDSCARSARAWGRMLHFIFAVETPEEVFYDALVYSIV